MVRNNILYLKIMLDYFLNADNIIFYICLRERLSLRTYLCILTRNVILIKCVERLFFVATYNLHIVIVMHPSYLSS